MNKFLVLFETSTTGYGARLVATGPHYGRDRARMAKAMEMHLSAMREDGDVIPEPSHLELLEAI